MSPCNDGSCERDLIEKLTAGDDDMATCLIGKFCEVEIFHNAGMMDSVCITVGERSGEQSRMYSC
jgi:hypothetical protein